MMVVYFSTCILDTLCTECRLYIFKAVGICNYYSGLKGELCELML